MVADRTGQTGIEAGGYGKRLRVGLHFTQPNLLGSLSKCHSRPIPSELLRTLSRHRQPLASRHTLIIRSAARASHSSRNRANRVRLGILQCLRNIPSLTPFTQLFVPDTGVPMNVYQALGARISSTFPSSSSISSRSFWISRTSAGYSGLLGSS